MITLKEPRRNYSFIAVYEDDKSNQWVCVEPGDKTDNQRYYCRISVIDGIIFSLDEPVHADNVDVIPFDHEAYLSSLAKPQPTSIDINGRTYFEKKDLPV